MNAEALLDSLLADPLWRQVAGVPRVFRRTIGPSLSLEVVRQSYGWGASVRREDVKVFLRAVAGVADLAALVSVLEG